MQIIESLQGVSVMNLDSSYAIPDVEAGTYTIRISSIGYIRETLYDVIVEPSLTTQMNSELIEDPRFNRDDLWFDCGFGYQVEIDTSNRSLHQEKKRTEIKRVNTIGVPASILVKYDSPVRVRYK